MPDAASAAFLDIIPEDSSGLLTVRQAAKLLAISASGLRRTQKAGRIPFFRFGRSVRFARADLARYLSEYRVESSG